MPYLSSAARQKNALGRAGKSIVMELLAIGVAWAMVIDFSIHPCQAAKRRPRNMSTFHPFSPKLKMWLEESLIEEGISPDSAKSLRKIYDGSYAIYPKRFYRRVNSLAAKKSYKYCFIGAFQVDKKTVKNRKWIINFAANLFGDDSYLQLTDAKTRNSHIPLGKYDHTIIKHGMVPKELPLKLRNNFDDNYFAVMANSKFCLCPAGDANWSMRFYEALMCKSIPIVANKDDTYRSQLESKLPYKYYTINEEHIYREDWAEENYELFLRYHTFEYGLSSFFCK